MSFRDKLGRVLDWTNEWIIRRTNGVPRGGGQWCMEVAVCKDRALFKGIAVANKGAAGFWVFLFDSPTRRDRAECCPLYVPGTASLSLDWSNSPRAMAQGIFVGASSDPNSYTPITDPDAWFEVAYEPLR